MWFNLSRSTIITLNCLKTQVTEPRLEKSNLKKRMFVGVWRFFDLMSNEQSTQNYDPAKTFLYALSVT